MAVLVGRYDVRRKWVAVLSFLIPAGLAFFLLTLPRSTYQAAIPDQPMPWFVGIVFAFLSLVWLGTDPARLIDQGRQMLAWLTVSTRAPRVEIDVRGIHFAAEGFRAWQSFSRVALHPGQDGFWLLLKPRDGASWPLLADHRLLPYSQPLPGGPFTGLIDARYLTLDLDKTRDLITAALGAPRPTSSLGDAGWSWGEVPGPVTLDAPVHIREAGMATARRILGELVFCAIIAFSMAILYGLVGSTRVLPIVAAVYVFMIGGRMLRLLRGRVVLAATPEGLYFRPLGRRRIAWSDIGAVQFMPLGMIVALRAGAQPRRRPWRRVQAGTALRFAGTDASPDLLRRRIRQP